MCHNSKSQSHVSYCPDSLCAMPVVIWCQVLYPLWWISGILNKWNEMIWNFSVVTCSLSSFTGFLDSFIGSVNVWRQNYEMRVAELPHPWNKHLSPFQKLILIRVFQPDKVSEVVQYGVWFVLLVKYFSMVCDLCCWWSISVWCVICVVGEVFQNGVWFVLLVKLLNMVCDLCCWWSSSVWCVICVVGEAWPWGWRQYS